MSVGEQASSETVNAILTGLNNSIRGLMQQAVVLNTWVNGQGQGLAFLEQLGYSSSSNPDNPGSQSDAAYALQLVDYLATVSGVWFGTANQPSDFDFDSAFAPVCGGNINP